MRGTRRVTAGLADQAVIALANAGNTLLAPVLLPLHVASGLLLAQGLVYFVMSASRAFVGDVLVALASRYDGEQRNRLVRNGLAAAGVIGVAGAVVLFLVGLFWPAGHNIDLRDLVWIAPFLPILLIQDTGRYSYISERRQDRALAVDLVWVGTQAVAVAVLWATHLASAGGLMVCWGLGAAAGCVVFLARTRLRPWRGQPRRWLVETRHLSGWFTATSLIGQVQIQVVGFLVAGQLSKDALALLRTGQLALIQPVQNFIQAVQGLVVPRESRLARDAGRLPGAGGEAAGAEFRKLTRVLTLAFVGLAVVMVAVVVPVASFVLVHIQKFAGIRPLALPLSLQAGIYLVQLPFAAGVRALHRGRLLFVQYAVFTTASLTALVIGAHAAGLRGAAWGLNIGGAIGLLMMVAVYRYALRRLGADEPDRYEQASADQVTVEPVTN